MTDHDHSGERAGGDDDELRELVVQCIDALHSGGRAAVDGLLSEHPEHAEALRTRLAKLERAGLLVAEERDPTEVPERLGEFRLLRRLGSGGMGVVYLAEQGSLGRNVALKLVRPEQRFFPGARARFRREIDAVARLGDAGIVPIHSVGEEQGIDYFTMEYVRGASLADVLAALHGSSPARLTGRVFVDIAAERGGAPAPERTPEVFHGTWTQATARVVARMARAAHHAHERGVVHRDLKPNNAMVTPDGRVLLLDFGLAAATGATRITRTGAQIGTLHYMAPEQLADGQVDARTDVYALGVTLYELLTFKSPFPSQGSEALRHDILRGAVSTLRARGTEIAPDLATIVEVAMDRDPALRYPTADALADDLTRFLEHRPIQARPLGHLLRLRRWSQRRPAAATALAFVAVSLLATPFLVRLTRDYADAEIAEARGRARANLESAVRALEGLVDAAHSEAMSTTPGLDKDRMEQLERATQLIESLAVGNEDDPIVAALRIRGLVQVAEARQVIGQAELALDAAERAEAVIDSIRPKVGDTPDLADDTTALELVRAGACVALGRFDDAAAVWRRVLAAHPDVDPVTSSSRLIMMLCTCHHNLARMATVSGDLDDAQRHIDAALALGEHIPNEQRDLRRVLDGLGTRLNLAALQHERDETSAARATLTKVREELGSLAEAHRGHPEVQRELARCEFSLSRVARSERREDEAHALRTSAIDALQALVAGFPERVAYRRELGLMLFEAAQETHDSGSARELLDAALAQYTELVARQRRQPEYMTEFATLLRHSARLDRAAHDDEGALSELVRATELQRAAAEAGTVDPYYLIQLGSLEDELSTLHSEAERWSDCRDCLGRAVDAYERAASLSRAEALEPGALPRVLMLLAQCELMCDDFDAAVRAVARLQEVRPLPQRELEAFGRDLHILDHPMFVPLLAAAVTRDAGRSDD
jgi:serine/threonine protein kinase